MDQLQATIKGDSRDAYAAADQGIQPGTVRNQTDYIEEGKEYVQTHRVKQARILLPMHGSEARPK